MNKTSKIHLNTCHPDLIELALAVNEEFPIQCICGHRIEKEQNKAYASGNSKLKWPHSAHNKLPSLAGDFIPDPDRNPATVDWNNLGPFESMCEKFEEKAKELGIEIKLGRDFKFKDYPHIELI
jgi:hypothetical protein